MDSLTSANSTGAWQATSPNARKSVMLTHMDEHAVDASEIDGLAYLSCSRFPADVRNV